VVLAQLIVSVTGDADVVLQSITLDTSPGRARTAEPGRPAFRGTGGHESSSPVSSPHAIETVDDFQSFRQ